MAEFAPWSVRDIHVDAQSGLSVITGQVGDLLLENGICVVRCFASASDAGISRRAVRNLLVPSTPLRALRVGAERVFGRDRTPEYLQRRPITLTESRWRLFGSTTFGLLEKVQSFNTMLAESDTISEVYGREVHRLNRAILNRFAPYEEFEKHQDSTMNVGLAFVLQTSLSLWHIHQGGPRADGPPFSFNTDAGDLVVLAQRSGELDGAKIQRHTGFSDFQVDGSVVHSAVNLTAKNRFTIQQFSDQTL